MKKAISYFTIGLLAYSFFLVSSVPATVVWKYAPIVNNVDVKDLSGSLWSGSAQSVTVQGITVNNVQWDFDLPALLSAKLGMNISVGQARSPIYAKGQLEFNGQTLKIDDLFVSSSLEHIQTLVDIPVPAQISGHLSLKATQLVLTKAGCASLDGQLNLQQGTVNTPFAQLDIGQINSTLSCNTQKLMAQIEQRSAMFDSKGALELMPNGHYKISSTVKPSESVSKNIVQGLSFMGKDNGEGIYNFDFNGRI